MKTLPLLFLSTLWLVLPVQATPPNTHCVINEAVVFNCQIGTKTLSICENDRRLQYRFGVVNNEDLTLPNDWDNQQSISYASQLLGSGKVDYYRFNNQDTDYLVYSGDLRGKLQSGVMIVAQGETKHNLTCNAYTPFDTSYSPKGKFREESSKESSVIDAFKKQ